MIPETHEEKGLQNSGFLLLGVISLFLLSKMRRSSLSVPSNIAEGYGRKTTADYIRFLYIAYGSNCELETQVLLSGDLGYLESIKLEGIPEKVNGIFDKEGIQEAERMLKALIKSLENKHLDPGILESLTTFLPTNWEKNLILELIQGGDNDG
ncbi:MAG: four helix bundle protein [Deltaproteobacteria bacterium]|nr:four helix bundle protein [Deltaproteobacteria bacterium]